MSNARYGVDDGPLDLIIEESGAGGVSSELAYLPPRVEFGTPEIMIASARAAGALDQLNQMKWRLPRHVWEGIFDVVEVQSSAAIDGHAASLVDLIIDEHVGIEPNRRRGILRAARLLGGTRDGDERLAVSSDTAELLGKRIGGYELRRVGTTAAARGLELIRSLLSDWERFSNAEADGFEPLVRVAICHAQFGLIHPFEDGNGLVGRMLLQLHLVRDQCLQVPVCITDCP